MRVLASALLLATTAATFPPDSPYDVGGRGFARLQDAIDAIGDGRGTILIRHGAHRQCAVQAAGDITYRATVPATAIFDGVTCEGKAALVLRGRAATIDGLVFQNMAVRDRNGAGIRLERGDLTVRNALFLRSEQGILTADDPRGRIRIEQSSFSGLGRCDGDYACAHSIYVGGYGSLSITRSRFEQGRGGHYVKSLAPRIAITDSSFDDSRGRATNYMIDLPAGATGEIARNVFVQGANKENYSAFVAVKAGERFDHPAAGLTIAANRASIAPGVRRSTVFVADWSGEAIRLAGNALGPGLKAFERR